MPLADEYEVTVTAEDIANGEQGCDEGCAIALALSRMLELPYIRVSLVDVRMAGATGGVERYNLPTEAEDFVGIFDSFGASHVQPFTFTMTKRS